MKSSQVLTFSIVVATVVFYCNCQDNPNVAAMFPAIMEQERESMKEPCDDTSEQDEYDFVIIGAGPAGCVVTNRLTEIEHWDVLLLEAGGEEPYIVDVPSLSPLLLGTDITWKNKVRSEKKLKSFENQEGNYATGRVMGGGTSVNGMVNVRGCKQAYDNWWMLGNPGWKYEDLLPQFKKVEDLEIPELNNSKYHSTEGKIKVSYAPYRSEIVTNFIEAGKALGYPEVDYNGETQTGTSLTQSTMGSGTRWSASRGYLHPIRERQNLHVKKRALVTRILIDENTKTAYGVSFTKEGRTYTVRARREVILSAGAMKSPQLLMISGVGPKEHLEKFDIKVIKDSKVGFNAIDHGAFLGLNFMINETFGQKHSEIYSNSNNYIDYFVSRKGPLSTNWGSSMVHTFLELENTPFFSPGWPVVEALYTYPTLIENDAFAAGFGFSDEMRREFIAPLKNVSAYQVAVYPISPKSRGRIFLEDTNINTPPLLDMDVLDREEDIEMTVAGIRKMIEFSKTQPLQEIGAKLFDVPLPACKDVEFNSDDYWRCAVVHTSIPSWHLGGTCKMGPLEDETAVVDHTLKVHGVNHLRVIDASIFPEHPSPYTQMPTYMVGEKGADLIKADHLK